MIQGHVERLPCSHDFRQHKMAKGRPKILRQDATDPSAPLPLSLLAQGPGRADVPSVIAGSVMGWRGGEMLFGDRDGETAFGGGGGEEDGLGGSPLLSSPLGEPRGRERGEMFCILIGTLTFAEIIRRRRRKRRQRRHPVGILVPKPNGWESKGCPLCSSTPCYLRGLSGYE